MGAQVEVAAMRDSLELGPPHREQVLEVRRGARVMRQLLRVVLAHTQVALADPVPEMPRTPLLDPEPEPLLGLCGRNEVLHLHLLELERAEDEVARRDLVPERLPDLRDAERRFPARNLGHVLEVDEDALGGLGAEVRILSGLLDRADPGLEHEIELPRLGEIALVGLSRVLARPSTALGLFELVGAVAAFAEPAVDEGIREAGHVPRRLPHGWVQDDRGVEGDDVVPLAHHRLQPACFTFSFSSTP